MVICSIDTLKKFLKKIATGIEKEIDASQQERKVKDRNDEILGFDLLFVS